MTGALIRAEVTRVLGRRATIIGSFIFTMLFAIGVLVWVLTTADVTSADVINDGGGVLAGPLVIYSIILGAIAGSYDIDKGTMRYLVLTGVPRTRLALVRIPGLVIVIVLLSLLPMALVILTSFVAESPGALAGDVLDMFYTNWIAAISYGLMSLAIGTFLRSSGVAIAVAIIANFVGSQLAFVIAFEVSRKAGELLFPIVVQVVATRDSSEYTISVSAAAAALVVWLTVLLGAATLRVKRAEY